MIFYRKTGNNIFDFYSSLKGEQFASSFGYVMTSLDCDGDGLVLVFYCCLLSIEVFGCFQPF